MFDGMSDKSMNYERFLKRELDFVEERIVVKMTMNLDEIIKRDQTNFSIKKVYTFHIEEVWWQSMFLYEGKNNNDGEMSQVRRVLVKM